MANRFDPKIGEVIQIFGEKYTFQRHPKTVIEMTFKQEGRRAIVYQIKRHDNNLFALKVFKSRFRVPSLKDSSEHLKNLESFEGLRAAKRRILIQPEPIIEQHSELEYAMLMPWIKGKTWNDILLGAQQSGASLEKSTAISLCSQFLRVMEGLEKVGIAHTDVAPGNVVIGDQKIDVQLLDLEDLYLPGIQTPPRGTHNIGASGYNHHSGASYWRPEGDRYATAIMAAEMLVLSNPQLARQVSEVGYFTAQHRTSEAASRFSQAERWLRDIAPEFATVFRRAWEANTLDECPPIYELHHAIREAVNKRTVDPPPPPPVGPPVRPFKPDEQTKVKEPDPELRTSSSVEWKKFNETLWMGERPGEQQLSVEPEAGETIRFQKAESSEPPDLFQTAELPSPSRKTFRVVFIIVVVVLLLLLIIGIISSNLR